MMACRNIVRRVWSVTHLRWVPTVTSCNMSNPLCHSTRTLHFPSCPRVLPHCLASIHCRGFSFNVQDSEDFTERVIKSNVPVLIDFHAQWCGPCKILGPRLEKAVAKQQGRVTMAKVDIDEHTDLAIEYGVSAVPTVVAMRDGKVLDQFVGIKDEDQLDSFVGKLVGP